MTKDGETSYEVWPFQFDEGDIVWIVSRHIWRTDEDEDDSRLGIWENDEDFHRLEFATEAEAEAKLVEIEERAA